jgi:hypothetical protein
LGVGTVRFVPWRPVGLWVGSAALILAGSFMADRVEEAFDPDWWTGVVRFAPGYIALQLYVAVKARPDGPVRWNWLRLRWLSEGPAEGDR